MPSGVLCHDEVRTIERSNTALALVVTVGARVCAIPVGHVVETMRPLPIEHLVGTPAFIQGISVIRGMPIPVVDLHALLDGGGTGAVCTRFVTVKVDDRRFALAVDSVVGLRTLRRAQLQDLPPLLRDTGPDIVESIGTLDETLLVVLRATRLVPDEVWGALATSMEAQ